MATVFMKWLETTPQDYDRGIRLLTLGRIQRIHERIAADYVDEGMRVLEIGCGTGTLALMMAKRGATVTAIDTAPTMLAKAEEKIVAEGLTDRVTLQCLDATLIEDRFPPASFDLIVASLLLSELSTQNAFSPRSAREDGSAMRSARWAAGRPTMPAGSPSSMTPTAASPAGPACCSARRTPLS